MHFDIESGSIITALLSMVVIGIGFWIIKKLEEL